MNMVQGILYVLLCWVCRRIKSERSGESPSLSTRRQKNEALGMLIRGNGLAKRFAKYIFLLFGTC